MTKFKLPEILGGIEVEEVGDQVHGLSTAVQTLMSHITVEVPGIGLVQIARDQLTEVKPPLPEEPPDDAVMVGRSGKVWLRGSHGWFVARHHGETVYISWPKLHREDGPLTRLVPDPVASAPELPYNSDGTTVEVKRLSSTDDLPVWLFVPSNWRTPEQAEEIAAAILRAAREARAAS